MITCKQFDELLIAGTPLPTEARQHLSQCPRCAALFRAQEHWSAAMQPSQPSAGLAKTANVILADLKPVRPLPGPAILMALLLLVVAVATALGIRWRGMEGFTLISQTGRIILYPLLIVGLFSLAYGIVRHMIPGSPVRFNISAVPGVLLLAFIAAVLALFHQHYNIDSFKVGSDCCLYGLLVAAFVTPFALLIARRGIWVDRPATARTLAGFAGAAGLFVLTVYCPVFDWRHVLPWHIGSVTLVILAGWLISKRLN